MTQDNHSIHMHLPTNTLLYIQAARSAQLTVDKLKVVEIFNGLLELGHIPSFQFPRTELLPIKGFWSRKEGDKEKGVNKPFCNT